jgi:hypothetical protein
VLHTAVLLQDRVDELERHDLRQRAQMTQREPARGHGELAGEPCQTGWCGTMTYGQRGTSKISSLGGLSDQRHHLALVLSEPSNPLPPAEIPQLPCIGSGPRLKFPLTSDSRLVRRHCRQDDRPAPIA